MLTSLELGWYKQFVFQRVQFFIFERWYTNFHKGIGRRIKGTWDIQKKILNNDDRTTYHSLQDTAINFTTQEVLSQYHDDINFTEQIMSRQKSFQPHIPTLLIWKDNVPTKQLNFSQLSLYLSSTNSSYNSYANCSFYP